MAQSKPTQNSAAKTPTKPISNSKSQAQKKPLVKEGKPPSSKIKSAPKSVVKTPRKDTQPPDLKKKKTLLLLSSGLTLVSFILVTIWILTQDSSTESFEKLVDTKNLNNGERSSLTDKENQNTNQLNIQQALVDSELKEISDSSNYLIKSTESFEKLVDTKNLNNSESNSVIDKVDISSNQNLLCRKKS